MRKDEMRLRLNSQPETGAQHGEAGIIISVEKRVPESQHPEYCDERQSDVNRAPLQVRNGTRAGKRHNHRETSFSANGGLGSTCGRRDDCTQVANIGRGSEPKL
jgi:hypothetical protein